MGKASKKLIRLQHALVIGEGRAITDDSPDEMLHELRIECKKLRYLMEFFSSLYDSSTLSALIKRLKLLQDNLGTFNDRCMQFEDMAAHLAALKPEDEGALRQSAALGALIAHLEDDKRRVRAAFHDTFAAFDGAKTHEAVQALFRKGGGAK